MEHININKECKQAMGSLGSNIGKKAVGRIGRSIEVMKVAQNFDSVNKVGDESGHHPRRNVQLDMEKLLAQLQDDDVYGHIRGRKLQIQEDSSEYDKKTSCFNSPSG